MNGYLVTAFWWHTRCILARLDEHVLDARCAVHMLTVSAWLDSLLRVFGVVRVW